MHGTKPINRIAVTGGNGYLGRSVVAALENTYDVIVLDKRVAHKDVSNAAVDMLNLDVLSANLNGCDAIIHLASIDAGINASAEEFYRTNTVGTWNVFHAGYELGIRNFVACSSSSVYGLSDADHSILPAYLPIDEEHPRRPLDPYGLSKHVSEIVAESFSRRKDMAISVLRPCYIAFGHLVSRMLNEQQERRVAQEGVSGPEPEPDEWAAPLPPHRSWIAPEDAARCFRMALEARIGGYSVFNVCADDTFISDATLPYLEATLNELPTLRTPPVYEKNPRAGVFDNTKAKEQLGWAPSSDWMEYAKRKAVDA